jgi:hypothetical protein
MFLKLKAEASGYPSWVRSSEDEDRYINDFKEAKGIQLDRESIGPNAAKRGLAKLCLNSLLGKFCERNNRTNTKMITDPLELYRFLATPEIEVTNITFVGEEACCVSWRFSAQEDIPSLRHTNEIIGCYVTAGARINLYSYLDSLKEKAIYCDTDSVFYVQPDNEAPLFKTSDRLGSMTSELKPGQYIREFVSGGPKNYAYRVYDSVTRQPIETICKIRGVTLNYSTSQQVNFNVIKNMILSGESEDSVTVHTDRKIKRKKNRADGVACSSYVSLVTEPEDKLYRVSFFKRRRLDDNSSVPFGYK